MSCSVDQCLEPVHCKGKCRRHYRREYTKTPTYKAYAKDYHSRYIKTPKYRAYHAAYERQRRLKNPKQYRASDQRYKALHAEARRKSQNASYQRNKIKRREEAKDYYYNKLRRCIEGVCPVCLLGDEHQVLNFDHDHKTGSHRGYLCRACNLALGCVKDSPETLTRLIAYLQGELRIPLKKRAG